jgi:hypothetical protein
MGDGAIQINDLKSTIRYRKYENALPAFHQRISQPARVIADAAGLRWEFGAEQCDDHG